LKRYVSFDGWPLFSAWRLDAYVTFLVSFCIVVGWRLGRHAWAQRGRGRVCVPSDAGRSPRGVEMLPAPAGAAGGPPRPTEKRPRRLERPVFYTCHPYEI